MLIATLLTIAKTWKQAKCSLTDEWIKKMWYMYTMNYYIAIKQLNNALCSNTDRPKDCHLSQVRYRHIIIHTHTHTRTHAQTHITESLCCTPKTNTIL